MESMNDNEATEAIELGQSLDREMTEQDPRVAALGCALTSAKRAKVAEATKSEFLKMCDQAWELSRK